MAETSLSSLDPDTTPGTPEERELVHNLLSPQTPEEIELVRNLLRGLRAFGRAGIHVNYEWCRVRRSPRGDSATMTIENLDSRRFTKN